MNWRRAATYFKHKHNVLCIPLTATAYLFSVLLCYDIILCILLRTRLFPRLPVPELSQSCSVRRHFFFGRKRESRIEKARRRPWPYYVGFKGASSPAPCRHPCFLSLYFPSVSQPVQISWACSRPFKCRLSALVVSFDPSACRSFVPVCHWYCYI